MVVDLCDQCPVLQLIDRDKQPIATHEVSPLAKQLSRQSREECPLRVVDVEVRAGDLSRPFRQAHFMGEFARDAAVVFSHFAKTQTGPSYVPIEDVPDGDDTFGKAGHDVATFPLHHRVLQRVRHELKVSRDVLSCRSPSDRADERAFNLWQAPRVTLPAASSSSFREVMRRIASLIADRGEIPATVQPTVEVVMKMWQGNDLLPHVLSDAKAGLWRYLEGKNGDSTTIDGIGDRTVRAALCLTDPPGDDEADRLEWAKTMLQPS